MSEDSKTKSKYKQFFQINTKEHYALCTINVLVERKVNK